MKKSTVLVPFLIGAAAAVPLVGRQRFRALVSREVDELLGSSALRVGPDQRRSRWDTLPDPVRRHLRYAIREDAPAVATAHLRHDGLFRTSPDLPWWAITGEQYFTTGTPGFIWNARVYPGPLLWIEVRDALLHERGNMLVKFLSAIPIANASGSEIDQGSTLRWLAECAWFPYAFVADCLQWAPVDDRTARATVCYEGPPASATIEVDDEGKLVRLRAERYRDLGNGNAALTAWGGVYSDYREFNGFRVPTSVDAGWGLETGWFSYARFRILTLDYDAKNGA
jgi:hypothetical protein